MARIIWLFDGLVAAAIAFLIYIGLFASVLVGLVFTQPFGFIAFLTTLSLYAITALVPVGVLPWIGGALLSRPAVLLRTTKLSWRLKRVLGPVMTVAVVLLEMLAVAAFYPKLGFAGWASPACIVGIGVAGGWVLWRELLTSRGSANRIGMSPVEWETPVP